MKERALPYPDLILFNGKIRSLAPSGSIYDAIACAGDQNERLPLAVDLVIDVNVVDLDPTAFDRFYLSHFDLTASRLFVSLEPFNP